MSNQQEVPMKMMYRLLIIFPAMIIFATFLSTGEASEADTYCYLQASRDVRVEVSNLDDEGNKGYVIWKGLIKQGDRKLIRTFAGQLRYSYTTDIEDNAPLQGDIGRWCNGGEIIGVPYKSRFESPP